MTRALRNDATCLLCRTTPVSPPPFVASKEVSLRNMEAIYICAVTTLIDAVQHGGIRC